MTPEKTVELEVDNYFVLFPHFYWSPENYISYSVGQNKFPEFSEVTDKFYGDLTKISGDDSFPPVARGCARNILEKREVENKKLGKIWEHICRMAPRVAETSASPSNAAENISLDEALSSIPPPVTYASDASVSTSVTRVVGYWPPKKVERWSEFRTDAANFDFSGEARFSAPEFCDDISVRVESDVDTAVSVNICRIMGQLLGPQFVFGKQKNSDFAQDPTIGRIIPDYTCRYFANDDDAGQIIFPIEVKRNLAVKELIKTRGSH
ncbi:serine/threonine-protein kinase brsk2-like isoform x3 [Gigaspora margarita]|uniref:Serine/threonine-protein kinase brsk2-like isoform x3 n=1 Tax=Gigaspora margarita TaxID=4874 RepID=A0A8H4B3Z2_GIGMA|nr:serine/threonine-protein kinase brsk2-like isoform x3 [Gigaspora margarita]